MFGFKVPVEQAEVDRDDMRDAVLKLVENGESVGRNLL